MQHACGRMRAHASACVPRMQHACPSAGTQVLVEALVATRAYLAEVILKPYNPTRSAQALGARSSVSPRQPCMFCVLHLHASTCVRMRVACVLRVACVHMRAIPRMRHACKRMRHACKCSTHACHMRGWHACGRMCAYVLHTCRIRVACVLHTWHVCGRM